MALKWPCSDWVAAAFVGVQTSSPATWQTTNSHLDVLLEEILTDASINESTETRFDDYHTALPDGQNNLLTSVVIMWLSGWLLQLALTLLLCSEKTHQAKSVFLFVKSVVQYNNETTVI